MEAFPFQMTAAVEALDQYFLPAVFLLLIAFSAVGLFTASGGEKAKHAALGGLSLVGFALFAFA